MQQNVQDNYVQYLGSTVFQMLLDHHQMVKGAVLEGEGCSGEMELLPALIMIEKLEEVEELYQMQLAVIIGTAPLMVNTVHPIDLVHVMEDSPAATGGGSMEDIHVESIEMKIVYID